MSSPVKEQFDEDEHPRDEDGKFASKGGEGSGSEKGDKQHPQIRTDAFKNWFGDWEKNPKNASKIVEPSGKPKMVFHGTPSDFDEFSKDNARTADAKHGFFFTSDSGEADEYSWGKGEHTGKIKPVFLNMRNPLVVDASHLKNYESKFNLSSIEKASDRDHDGVIFKNYPGIKNRSDYYFVFDPNQTKLNILFL